MHFSEYLANTKLIQISRKQVTSSLPLHVITQEQMTHKQKLVLLQHTSLARGYKNTILVPSVVKETMAFLHVLSLGVIYLELQMQHSSFSWFSMIY